MMMVSFLQRWIWHDRQRCARRLLAFAETEADGGRDLARAAELTKDPILRRLYLMHAMDEFHHAELFRKHGTRLLDHQRMATQGMATQGMARTFTPGERGLDDVTVDGTTDAELLAFLHLSEKAAAVQFEKYRVATGHDADTAALFSAILSDETFHMKYTAAQLARVAPGHHRRFLWKARAGRFWRAYKRAAVA
jgi:hypothetical protein